MAAASGENDGSGGVRPERHPGPDPGQASPQPGARGAWRRWRHTRPFWGGLLVTLGGAEILLSERAPLPLVIHIGLQGLAGYLLPTVMVLCGVLLLFHPVQKTFYSVLAVVLALGSWITSNLGGFFLGMLLGVIGGSLAFAWQWQDQRGTRQRRRRRRRREPSAGLALVVPSRDGEAARPGEREGGPRGEPAGGAGAIRAQPEPGTKDEGAGPAAGRWLATAVLAVPLAPLALSVLAVPPPAGRPVSSLSASPSSAPAVTSRTPIPASPASPASPAPSASPSPAPSTTPSATPSPSPAPSPSTAGKRRRHLPEASRPAARAAAAHSQLAARSAVFTRFTFDGIATVPTAIGTVAMLKFSIGWLTLSGGTTLEVRQAGNITAARGSLLRFENVELYVTRLSGDLNGSHVTFTARRPPPAHRSDLTLTNVVADQPYTVAGSLYASGLAITAESPR